MVQDSLCGYRFVLSQYSNIKRDQTATVCVREAGSGERRNLSVRGRGGKGNENKCYLSRHLNHFPIPGLCFVVFIKKTQSCHYFLILLRSQVPFISLWTQEHPLLSPKNNDTKSWKCEDVGKIHICRYESHVVLWTMTLDAIVSLQVIVTKCLFSINAEPATGRRQDVSCLWTRAQVRYEKEEEQVSVNKFFSVGDLLCFFGIGQSFV